jgi:hypothetical protein
MTTTTGAETTTLGAATTTKAAGSTPPLPPPVAITSEADPSSQYALCIAISARGHSGSASLRKKDHVPFIVVAAPPLVRLRLLPLIRLSFASMAGCHVTFCRVASTLRRASRRPIHSMHGSITVAAVAPSITVADALPLCRPSPPSLADCCRFHRHRCINVHHSLLPLWSLCCACHRRPLPLHHPLPPLLVDCCIFHVHCHIAVHRRRSMAPTIAVNAVTVA